MPAGVSFRGQRKDSGYKQIDGTITQIKEQGDTDYNYTIRENGTAYDDHQQTNWISVDKISVLNKNGNYLTVEQHSVHLKIIKDWIS